MGSQTQTTNMKFLVALCVFVASVSSKPRYLVIPLEDVEFGPMTQQLPVYRMSELARQARQAQEESYQEPRSTYQQQPRTYQQSADRRDDSQASGSNIYSAPATDDHVDMGAYTGKGGAFGWYSDHPVLLAGH